MRRKQKKSLPWGRFGYVILIIIKFSELLLWISLTIINVLRSYIKRSKECFIRYPNTSKLVKKNSAAPRFNNPLLSVRISDDILREKQNKLGKITVRYWYVFYCIIGYSYRASKDAGYKTLATLVKHSACQIYQVECVMQLWYKKVTEARGVSFPMFRGR